MKLSINKLLFCVVFCFSLTNLFAQNKTVILEEDFENGIPSTWTQEKVRGDYEWVVESGNLTHPTGTTSGSKRVAFRNNTSQTTGYITRLVLPQLDLTKVFQPILCFSYAQDKWSGDFDTLKILYRRTSSSNWITLKTYDSYSSFWQRDTIRLAAATSTYQLAFEAKDNLGRGVVIDDIEIRSIPNCTEPFNLMVSKIGGTSARLEWAGSFDALNYRIKVSTKPMSDEELFADNDYYEVDGAEYSYVIDGLVPATKYYFYVQSKCVGEDSEWSDAGEFKTSDILDLPYYETFNMDYVENTVSSLSNWFCYSSNRIVPPYINTDHLKSKRLKYSPDSTTALFFNGAYDEETAIISGAYSYAVVPEVYVDSIKHVQVSFWTINNLADGSKTALADFCKIIVGVMTDPSDKNTFVPVDTVEITSIQDFEEKFVSFENYEGNGKYIAFMSDFKDGRNAFVIDNLLVEKIPTTPKAYISVALPTADALEVSFVEQSERYEVLISNAKLDTRKIDSKKVIAREEFTSFPCRIEGLNPWVNYFVYARHINTNDTGAWSNASAILMPEEFDTVPTTVSFDINTFDILSYYNPGKSTYKMCNGLLALSNGTAFPECSQQYWTEPPKARSPWELAFMATHAGTYQMVIFPELINPEETSVSFYATRHLVETGAFAIGIVSDANDVESFQAIDTIILTGSNSQLNKYENYTYKLGEYNLKGNFFAIKAAYDYCNSPVKVWIDDVRFYENDGCGEPNSINASVSDDKVTITWADNGASSWNVLISRKEFSADEIDGLEKSEYFTKQSTDKPSIVINGLDMGEKTYYYYIQSECNGKLSIWTNPQSFTTECPKQEKVPYYMNFDDEEWTASPYLETFPIPCLYTVSSSYQGAEPSDLFYYPNLSTTVATSGTKSLNLAGSVADGYSSYIAFPLMDRALNLLQISFDVIADSFSSVLEVGVLSNPLDIKTFETIAEITPSNVWSKKVVKFTDYEGEKQYIAIRTAGVKNNNYIDNVAIEFMAPGGDDPQPENPCAAPTNLKAGSITQTSASLSWTSDASEFKLVVANRELTIDERDNAVVGNAILVAETTSAKTYSLSNLKAGATYFYYVKALCGDGLSSVWSVARLNTECAMLDTYRMGVETFDNYGVGEGTKPNCYIVGNLSESDSLVYIPYCSDEYAHSGSASLMLQSSAASNGAYAITPKIDIDNISRLRVRFNASVGDYFTSQYARELIVAIVTDPDKLETQTNIEELKIYPGESMQYEVRFDEYIGDYNDDLGQYVMFLSFSDKDNIVFIDDVVFDTIPDCVSPKVRVKSTDVNSIDLELYNGTAPYKVKYITGDFSQDNLDNATIHNVTDGNFKIDNLKQNTDCFVMVASDCGDWSPVMCFTSANLTIVDLPYYDSFAQNKFYGEYNNPLDWTTMYTSEEGFEKYRYPYVDVDGGGDEVVYLYSDNAAEMSYMATPMINVDDLNKCQVSFNIKPDVASPKSQRSIVVGVVSDISDKGRMTSTFQPIDTIKLAGSTQYSQQVVSLAGYSGSAKHVAFMVTQSLNRAKLTDKNGTYGGCFIDDVWVELIPSCQRPVNFKLQSIGDTYAKFVFSHAGAIKYEVKYGLAGFDVETSGTVMNVTDTMFTVEGLQSNTEYDFYVRAYCSETNISEWSLCERHTTFEVPVSVFPYDNKFDNQEENSLWKITNNSSQAGINRWYMSDSLYISSDNGLSSIYSDKETKTWAYRTFDLKEGVYTISFDWLAKGDATDYMRVMLIPALSQFVEGDAEVYNFDGTTVTLSSAKQTLPADWIDLSRDGRVFNSSTSWSTYSKTFLVTPEMAGFYRLVFYWENDREVASGKNISVAIDNIFFEKASCSYPYKFDIQDINSTYLTLGWTPIGVTPKSYNVVALLKAGNPDEIESAYVAYRTTTNTNVVTLQNLTSSTDYYIYVQANCDGNSDLSYWSDVYEFTTPCDPKPLGTVFSFEESEGYYLPNYNDGEPNTSYRVPDCFVQGHSNAEEYVYIKDNTVAYPHSYRSGIYNVARTGQYALKLYSDSEEEIGGYMALPLIDGNFDELQVSFWIRPFGSVNGTDNINSIGLNTVFARKITVGTMTNPNDPSTFEALQVVSYPYSSESSEMASGSFVFDDVEGHNYWRKHSVLLKGAKGKFIAFKNEMYDGKENNQMYIDDVVVGYISDCMVPSSLMVEEATSTTAKLNATTNGDGLFEVQISVKEDFDNVWRTDTVTSFPVVLENLLSGQDYFIRAREICGETNYSEWSSVTTCITAYSTLYSTDSLGTFNVKTFTPRHWQRSCGTSAADIFSKAGSAMITTPSSPLGWTVQDNHLVTYVSSFESRTSNPYSWIFSSSIELPEGDVAMLFDMALTDDDGVHRPDSTISNLNDKFYVVISEDNGRSWEEHNKFTWTNTGDGDFDYNSIPFEGGTYYLDLSKYAGKIIRIAFYSECRSARTSQLHIDDIRINASVDSDVDVEICETEDYYYQEFFKLSTELNVGANSFVYHKRAEKLNDIDSIFYIDINVKPLVEKHIDAMICEGEVYNQYNFNNLTLSGVYKQKIMTSTSCDSVVTVNLTVNKVQKTLLTDTICFGGSYSWNGKEYNRTGMYVDTLSSLVTGCDSIVTLLLDVSEASVFNDTVDICKGQKYLFGSLEITESGIYTETFESEAGCDSIVNLVVNVEDDLRLILNEFICPGEKYNGHGFKGVPKGGTYTLPLTSSGGCDSTIVLNLMELTDDTIYVKQEITLNDLPYTFVDKVYDKNTKVGVYTDEFYVERENCASVVILQLEVGEPVAVENISIGDLALYPNPVAAGESIYIDGEFTSAELDGMQVEIYSMLGQCVSRFTPYAQPILVDGLSERGMYIVRVLAGNGTVYQGKLIVK